MFEQAVQIHIRLLQSDQGLHCLAFHQHLLDAFLFYKRPCCIKGEGYLEPTV